MPKQTGFARLFYFSINQKHQKRNQVATRFLFHIEQNRDLNSRAIQIFPAAHAFLQKDVFCEIYIQCGRSGRTHQLCKKYRAERGFGVSGGTRHAANRRKALHELLSTLVYVRSTTPCLFY